MATSFSLSKSKALGSTRSISLPSRSHPTTAKTEEELNKLKSWETTSAESSVDAEVICAGLHALSELQKSVDSLLTSPHTIQALSRHEKWADQLLENSVKILDICGTTREIVSQFKESLWDLQSCLRRRKGNHLSNKNKHNSLVKQGARRLITSLKKLDQEIWTPVLLDFDDHHVCAVIRALRESSSVANSVLQKVLLFLSMVASNSNSKPKPSKWALVSRLVLHKGAIASSQEEELRTKKIDELERLGAQLEGIENGLENSFRALIRSRTSLLNVISCH
nr:uncharacterized protein LOC109177557 [Ipomoea trifida]